MQRGLGDYAFTLELCPTSLWKLFCFWCFFLILVLQCFSRTNPYHMDEDLNHTWIQKCTTQISDTVLCRFYQWLRSLCKMYTLHLYTSSMIWSCSSCSKNNISLVCLAASLLPLKDKRIRYLLITAISSMHVLITGLCLQVMNEKLNHCSEMAELLRTHLSEQHSFRLEWGIIALITIEVSWWKTKIIPSHQEINVWKWNDMVREFWVTYKDSNESLIKTATQK